MATNIDELLSQDEQIDNLSDKEIEDCWIRCTLVKHASITEKNTVVDQLAHTHSGVLRQVWLEQLDTSPPTDLSYSDDESNIRVAFGDMTQDRPKDELHQSAREHLKRWCRQSGVPIAKIAHKRVSHYTDN